MDPSNLDPLWDVLHMLLFLTPNANYNKLDPWNWTNQDSQSVLYGKKLNVASQPCLNQLILPSNYVFLDVSCLKKLKYTTLPLKKWQLIFRKKLCVYFSATQVSKHFLLLKMYVWSQSCCLWEQVPLLF